MTSVQYVCNVTWKRNITDHFKRRVRKEIKHKFTQICYKRDCISQVGIYDNWKRYILRSGKCMSNRVKSVCSWEIQCWHRCIQIPWCKQDLCGYVKLVNQNVCKVDSKVENKMKLPISYNLLRLLWVSEPDETSQQCFSRIGSHQKLGHIKLTRTTAYLSAEIRSFHVT